MDVVRFQKVPPRANDPARRYRIVRGIDREDVGELTVVRDAKNGETVGFTVLCVPTLSDASREDVLMTARRFLAELVTGWGLQLAEQPCVGWVELPDGNFVNRMDFPLAVADL